MMDTESLRKLAVIAGVGPMYSEEGRGLFLDYCEMDKPWSPHTNTAQAFEVVAGLHSQDENEFEVNIQYDSEHGNWKVGIYCQMLHFNAAHNEIASTPAEAICLAALKTIEQG